MSTQEIAGPKLIDTAAIGAELDYILVHYQSLPAQELATLLDRPMAMDEAVSLGMAHSAFQSTVAERAQAVSDELRQEVLAEFPHGYIDGEAALSPKRFLQGDGTNRREIRKQLQAARDQQLEAASQELDQRLAGRQPDLNSVPPVGDEVLADVLEVSREDLYHEVAACLAGIHELVELRRFKGIGRKVLAVVAGVSRSWLHIKAPIEEFDAKIKHLSDLLLAAHEGDWVQAAVAQYFTPAIDVCLSETISEDFEEIAESHASLLPQKLELSYRQVVQAHPTGPTIPHPVEPLSLSTPRLAEPAKPAETPGEQDTIPEQETETLVGEIASPFPWAPNETIEINVVGSNGSRVVVCKALSSTAKEVSSSLRKLDSTAKNFDRMWEQVVQIELTNPKGTHGYIQKVRDVASELFKGLAILNYGNLQTNAKRLYYVKTTCERYPEIASMVEELGVAGTQHLLILVAETDKANQIKTYSDFGITHKVAKSKNVGSI